MLVLIATDHQPIRPHLSKGQAVDGELVAPVVVECGDDRCTTCQGSWLGLVSHGNTPTAMVVDRPGVTEADLRSRLHDWLDCTGTIDSVVQASEAGEYEIDGHRVVDPVAAVDELIGDHIGEIHEICRTYPVGTVVSRLGHLVAPFSGDIACERAPRRAA